MKRTSLLPRLFSRHLSLGLLVGAAAVIGVACGASPDGNGFDTGGSGQGGNSSGNGNGVGGNFTTSNGSGGSTGTGFQECATSSDEATLVPLNMIIMFDRSGSMDSNNKWDDSTAALRAFIQSPSAAGLRVALRFFPTDGDGCDGNNCATNVCAIPEVNAGELTSDSAPTDQQEELLVSAIDNEDANGADTPIHAALGGATQWAKDYLVAHPNEKAVVVFVTDGEPNGCPESSSAISGLAAEAFTSAGVYTYAVGLDGSEEALMNDIAEAGGTTQGIFIGAGANAEQELLTALEAIRGSQLACEFQMPQAAAGEEIDPNKINVEYTASGGGQPQVIQQVADAAACGPGGGWYYDNPAAPTAITLCPTTCDAVQADTEGSIRVVVGCATEAAE